jgi:hypothetical protein
LAVKLNPGAEPLVTGAPSFHYRHFARWSLLLVEGGRSFPLSCKTGCGLGCGWDFGDLGVLERDDLPLVLFLYDDQRWARFYFARFVAFLELHVASGEYHRDIGAQKADAP